MTISKDAMRRLDGLAPVADRYDGFVVDLWGVVHDGVAPYPEALDCLERLRERGARVVLLSNAPRRAQAAQARLREMGVADELYTGLMTSGEAAHRMLRDLGGLDPGFGPRLFHLGPARDRNLFEGLNHVAVATPEEADWVLNTGPDDEGDPAAPIDHLPALRACAARGLPMLCANPDLEVMRGPHRLACAGALAELYNEMGGRVRMLGKPDPAIYRPVLAMLDAPPGRVLAIGDSLRTDIAGAAAAGLDACWILGGIHRHEDPGPAASAAGLAPRYVADRLAWGAA